MEFLTATPVLRPRADASSSTTSYSTGSDGCVICPTALSCPSCPAGQECNQTVRTCDSCTEYKCVDSASGSSLSTNVGAIVGGVIGGIGAVVVALILYYFLVYRKKHPRGSSDLAISEIKLDGSDTVNFEGASHVSGENAERPVAQRSALSNSLTKNHRLSAYETFMRPPRHNKRGAGAGTRKVLPGERLYTFSPYGDGDLSKRNSVATTISTTNASNILPIAYIPGVTIRPTKNNTRSIYLYDTDSVFSDLAGIDNALIVHQQGGQQTRTAIKAQPKLVNVARIDEDDEDDDDDEPWNQTELTKAPSVVEGSRTADTLTDSVHFRAGHESEPDLDVDLDIGEIHRATSVRRPDVLVDLDPPVRRDDESGSFVLDISKQ